VILICSAVVFLVVLFLLKNTSILKNTVNFVRGEGEGLTYNTVAIGDLVNKDTDGDGILDWEEPLWGLDPTKTETTPGVPDSSVIKKLKAEQSSSAPETSGDYTENLTETDKFSRELFSTIASLSQSGAMDEATAEQPSNDLMEKMRNSAPAKVFTLSDIKTTNDNSVAAITKYINLVNTLDNNLIKKYPAKGTVTKILQKFVIDENNVDVSVLKDLDPNIKQAQEGISGMLKIFVPSELAQIHLDLINATERLMENMMDFQLFETDPVIAMSGMSKYEENMHLYTLTFETFINTIRQKLNIE
jgi:hypothetical protein